jgi:hypothetical protein
MLVLKPSKTPIIGFYRNSPIENQLITGLETMVLGFFDRLAGTLIAGEHPAATNLLSSIAFNQGSVVFEERITIQEETEGILEGFQLGF